MDAVDAGRKAAGSLDENTAGPSPAGGAPAPLAVSSMGTPPVSAPPGDVLAVSSIAPQPMIAAQPSAQTATVSGQVTGVPGQTEGAPTSGVETLPSYPPRTGITTGRLCAAAIGSIMGLTELQVGIQHETPVIARVGYQRSDRTQWTYDCRFDGSHITWRTVEDGRPGRWRTDPTDEVITFTMTPGGASVTVNGEVVRLAA